MSVVFEYWGQSEIGTRLSDQKHHGRHWFWFNEERFSNSWFVSRIDEAVNNARDRYTPELNINLPIRTNFYALGRTPAFFERLERLYSRRGLVKSCIQPPDQNHSKKNTQYQGRAGLFRKIEPRSHNKDYLEWTVTQPIPWDDIGRQDVVAKPRRL
jgi:hypothetical protein